MATYFSDDFANLATLWTVRWNTASAAWTVTSGDLSNGAISPNDWRAVTLNAANDADSDDIEVLFIVRATALSQFACVVRGSGADEAATNYSLQIGGLTLRVYYCSGADAPTQVVSVSKTHSTSTDYWCRFRVNATTIRARTWTGAIGDEPGTWDIDTTDSTVSGTGWAGPSGYNVPASNCTWKQVGYGTNGDTAPHAASASATSIPFSRAFPRAILNF